MRRLVSIAERVRAISRVGAAVTAFVLIASGCQLITGSYSVGSSDTVCAGLAGCCASLGASEQTTCFAAVASENESQCSGFQATLPSNACSGSTTNPHPEGGVIIVLFDAHTQRDASSTQHDATMPDDANQEDDATPGDDANEGNDANDASEGNDANEGDDANQGDAGNDANPLDDGGDDGSFSSED